jgi:hypothetical protein
MIRTKLFMACALAFAVSLVGTPASAQEPVNQITYFTFSAPFELPGGKTLPAGKYVFKIVDSPSNRHIVHIMSEDQQTMHATVMAIPAQRMEPADEPEVRFMEAEANAAPAIRTWWYPGRSIGHEFIYPKDHARRLAARQSEGVLTTAGDTTSDDAMRSGELARIGADGRETAEAVSANADQNANAAANTAANTTAAATPEPQTSSAQPSTSGTVTSAESQPQQPTTAEPAERQATAQPRAESEQRSAAAQPQANDTARTELPRTASALPLIALLGLGSLVGAGLLRFRR